MNMKDHIPIFIPELIFQDMNYDPFEDNKN